MGFVWTCCEHALFRRLQRNSEHHPGATGLHRTCRRQLEAAECSVTLSSPVAVIVYVVNVVDSMVIPILTAVVREVSGERLALPQFWSLGLGLA